MNTKRLAPLVWLLILCLGLTACGGTGKRDNEDGRHQGAGQAQSKAREDDGGNGKKGGNGKRSSARQRADGSAVPRWKTLAGGSESEARVLKPMDNYLLQRKYPNVFVLHAPEDENRIALTFDDGPDSRFTPRVLDVLKKHNVKATFFVMGSRVKGVPRVARRIADEGHVMGNHTYWHPKLWRQSAGRIRWEALETDHAILEVAGYAPKLFRPPYGALTEELLTQLSAMNYTVVGWNVDSLDWKQLPADQVEANVVSNVRPGSIILMHSGGNWDQDLSGMVEALDRIIPRLKEQGMTFVTIPELLGVPKSK